jgi:hypothetical protein
MVKIGAITRWRSRLRVAKADLARTAAAQSGHLAKRRRRLSAKTEISPKGKPSDARAVRFSEPRRIRLVAWQRLSGLASVLGEQQCHQLIDRCR